VRYTGRIVCMSLFLTSTTIFKVNDYLTLGYIPVYEYIYSLIFVFPIWWAGKKYDESKYYYKKLQQTTKQIQERETKYRIITENSNDLIQEFDHNGFIRYASPSHKKVLGYQPVEFVGRHVFEDIHPKSKEIIEARLSDPTNHDLISTPLEVQIQHKDGSWIWLESFAQPFIGQNGEPEYFIVTARDITEKKRNEQMLIELAYYDPLTGVPNRRLLFENMSKAIKEANQCNHSMAIIYMDIDNFKQINDNLGHDIGDQLLKQFTKRVESCIRKSDLLARLGGDEFVILLPVIHNTNDPYMMAKRIVECLQTPWIIGEHSFFTSSSIGIALLKEGEGYHDLLQRADRALYNAKESGKNTVKIAGRKLQPIT